jgi:hypothetical protein
MFSCFVISKPTAKQMIEAKDVCGLASSRMNPHCNTHATNEENMLDWDSDMTQLKDRVQILLSKIQEDVAVAASVQVLSTEARAIDTVLERNGATYNEEARPCCGSLFPERPTRSQVHWLACHLPLMIKSCTDV